MEISRFSLSGTVDYTDPKFYEVMCGIVYGALGSEDVAVLDLSEVTLLTHEAALLMVGYLTLRDRSRNTAYHVLVAGAGNRTRRLLDRAAENLGTVLLHLENGVLAVRWPGYRLTGEQECYDKLKEIGESSTSDLSDALGKPGSRTAVSTMLNRLKEWGLVDIRPARSTSGRRPSVMYRVFEPPEEVATVSI